MSAAHAAYPAWRATPVAERLRLVRRVADIMEARVYDMAAALTLEVGKNRMEALGEAQETVDFFRHYADDFEQHEGYEHELPNDPLPDVVSRNRSVMRPYGAWVVIAPFNFPLALAGGPTAAALVTGNTVVVKGSTDTPWAGRLLADCIRDAGLPAGRVPLSLGLGQRGRRGAGGASGHRRHHVHGLGRRSARTCCGRWRRGAWPRPCIAEMGGKNPCIVTAHANLERRRGRHRALGLRHGRAEVLGAVAAVRGPRASRTNWSSGCARRSPRSRIGDPCRREHWLGPVISANAAANHVRYVRELQAGGATVLAGGRELREGALARGHYVDPTLAEAPLNHRLWRHEMFLPILMLHRVDDRDEAMRLANESDLGLTAGFYGGVDEVPWFHEHIEAGVTYANRRQGATTGAWPGYQPFGGWKGSGSTGKAIASFYYLAQYLREQSRTVVEP